MAYSVLKVALVAAVAGVFAVQPGWHDVEDEACGFTVSMPAAPEASVDTTQAPIGTIISRRYLAFDDVDSYTATCSLLPPAFFASVDPVAFLNEGPERFVAGSGGEVLFREVVRIGDQPGVRHAVRSGELYVYSEAYVVDDRLFQLSVSKWEETRFGQDAKLDQFFGSFDLKP